VARKSWDPERWTYQVREVSAGVYEAVADDHSHPERDPAFVLRA